MFLMFNFKISKSNEYLLISAAKGKLELTDLFL